MLKRSTIAGVGSVLIIATAYWIITGDLRSSEVKYQLAEITVGDVKQTVSATGSVSPVTTVEVGTQISGTIDTVLADYNDLVEAGQVLAVLDTTLLQASVLNAEASVEKAGALLEGAETDHRCNKSLFERQLIAESEYIPFKIALQTRTADLKAAQASLVRAQRDLQNAVIDSPIDGIVIQRNVEEGQTIAASLSTPTLFVIAQDLSQMEILAEVDESDIGAIEVEQAVEFEVVSHPDQTFNGTVSQIRLQPSVVSNVVTYTVVVAASNPDGLLLPGMTATLDFVTDERIDVLTVPTRALSIKPASDVLEDLRTRRQQARSASHGSDDLPSPQPEVADSQRPNGVVWYLDSIGQVTPAPLFAGLSDGSTTEVVQSRDLSAGMQVIVGSNTSGDDDVSSTGQGLLRPPGGGPGGGRGSRGF